MINKPNGFIYINGTALPYPDKESGLQTISTIVDSARTVDGVMRGEKVGRDLTKIEMTWNVLTPSEWQRILNLVSDFTFNVEYFDMKTQSWVSKLFYCGDRTASPFMINPANGIPKYYKNCTVNIIDVGI